jgi:hypothetical protein
MDVRSNGELGLQSMLHEEKNESHNPNRPPKTADKSSNAPNAARQIKGHLGPVNLPKKTAVARTKQSMPDRKQNPSSHSNGGNCVVRRHL